jgi:hypothetical protein
MDDFVKDIMSQIPEDLIKAMMDATGMDRKAVEQFVKSHLLAMGYQGAEGGRQTGSGKPKPGKSPYTYDCYPHYLPAAQVHKYTVRITLKHIQPAIWRRIVVPSNITLRHLGDLILELMGWEGEHLNQFRQGDNCYLPYYQREPSGEANFVWSCNNVNQEDYTIADLLQKKQQSVIFEYDFGDSWEHEIRLSSIAEYADDEQRLIEFKAGERACPPEDCGGIWGYEHLLEILAKRKSGKRLTADEREELEWACWDEDYDPDYLDLDYCREVAESFNDAPETYTARHSVVS